MPPGFSIMSMDKCYCERVHPIGSKEMKSRMFVLDNVLSIATHLEQMGKYSIVNCCHFGGTDNNSFHVAFMGGLDPEAASIAQQILISRGIFNHAMFMIEPF